MLGKQALKTGVEIASDALNGQNLKTSAKTRIRQAGLAMTSRASKQLSRKPTRGKRPLKRKAAGTSLRKAPSKRSKRTPDIFDR